MNLQAPDSIGKGVRNVLYLMALAVAWLQGNGPVPGGQEATSIWSMLAAIGSLGSFIVVIILAFHMGRWTGTFGQKVLTLEQEVRNINSSGCGVAARLHPNNSLRNRRLSDEPED